MSPFTHGTRTLLLFGCTSLAALSGACGGGSSQASRYISVSWSVVDRATNTQVSCAQLQNFGIDIFDGSNAIYFSNQSCNAGVVYSTTGNLQKGVYVGQLELLAPNGSVLTQEQNASFDLTRPGEYPLSRDYQVDDVCARNRYLILDWEVDRNGGRFNCAQGSSYAVNLSVGPADVYELSSGDCDDGQFYNQRGSTEDGINPGTYSVAATLLDANGTAVSQTPSQLVTVGSCSPGVLQNVAFAVR